MVRHDELCTLVRGELGLRSEARRHHRLQTGALSAMVVLWGLGSGPAQAQAPYQQEHLPGFSSLLVGQRSLPSVGDLDGDGDFDVVVGERYGGLSLFENAGSSRVPAFEVPLGSANPFGGIDVGYQSIPALVDLDSDGDLDAVVGAGYLNLRTFENTGTSNAPAFVARTGTANPFAVAGISTGEYSSPALADLDGDGDFDAAVGEWGGTVLMFENTGNPYVPAFEERTGTANPFDGFDFGSSAFPELVDLDGDGDLDAVIGGSPGRLRTFENVGSTMHPRFVEQTGAANPFEVLGIRGANRADFADVDDDGDLDALVGGFLGSLRLLENTGSTSEPAFVERLGSASPFGGSRIDSDRHPHLVDLDGDSDFDVVSGDSSGRLSVFENTGSPQTPAFGEMPQTAGPFDGFDLGILSTPSMVDLDGDGDSDAVVGVGVGGLKVLENTGSTRAPAFSELAGSANPLDGIFAGYLASPSLADIDGDGDFDVVTGEEYGRLLLFENTGSSAVPAFVGHSGSSNPFDGIDVGDQSHPELSDLDGDGDLDLVVGQDYGQIFAFENEGSATAPSFVRLTGDANPFAGFRLDSTAATFADLDDDGDLDVLLGEDFGRIVFLRSLHRIFADGFEGGDTSSWSKSVP